MIPLHAGEPSRPVALLTIEPPVVEGCLEVFLVEDVVRIKKHRYEISQVLELCDCTSFRRFRLSENKGPVRSAKVADQAKTMNAPVAIKPNREPRLETKSRARLPPGQMLQFLGFRSSAL